MIKVCAIAAALVTSGIAAGQSPEPKAPEQPAQSAEASESKPFVPELVRQAAAVSPLVESELARGFLATAGQLPEIEPRAILSDPETREAFTPEQAAALTRERREKLRERTRDARFYYTTGYGSPMIYARPLDILARHGVGSLSGRKIMDFGYGMIGQERMFALLGADVHGIEVEPLFKTLYSWPGDTGEIVSASGTKGHLTLHHGQWPADAALREKAGAGFDVIMSKNTLKKGYIHPAVEVDPRMLVHLGVSDEEFLRAVHSALKPGGLFLVYNISGKQNPPDKPYLPMADGAFPFARSLVEKAGFQVLAFDEPDHDAMAGIFVALGHDQGKGKEKMLEELFTHYTLLRRPAE
jgi:hypothetical protein